jgi:hypothetical protein
MAANYIQTPFNENTQDFKKHYDSNVYVVFPNHHFSIKKNSTRPVFSCFIKQNGEQFGDPLGAVMPNGTVVIFRLTSISDIVVVNSNMSLNDAHLGEWLFTFNQFDLNDTGLYDGEIILSNGTLENSIAKFKINVI